MPQLAALVTLLIAVLDLVGVLLPKAGRHIDKLHDVLPGLVLLSATNRAGVLLIALLLILLSHALRRRKRRAWRAVVALLAASVLLHLGEMPLFYEYRGWPGVVVEAVRATPAVALLAALVAFRRQFYASGDPRTRWRALQAFVLLAVGDIVIGLVWLLVGRTRFVLGDVTTSEALWHVLLGLIGIEGPVTFRSEVASDVSYGMLVLLGGFTAVVTVYLLLRPAEPAPRLTAGDRERIGALLAKNGDDDSLGYFALRQDKSVIWSPSGKAGVMYRVVSGVMLASGDPVGDPEAWPQAIAAFVEEADRHAWVPAVLACGERAGEVWVREAGLTALELGDEAVVDVADFTLDGRAMRGVRQAVGRLERKGYQAQVRRVGELGDTERRQLRQEAENWRRSETERGFSMALGRFVTAADSDCVVVTARQDDELRGFLQLVPWGGGGLSLDVMRRDTAAADNGVNEFLIVSLLREAPRLGVTRVSLNFAVFRSALARGERLGAGPVMRIMHSTLLFLSRWFQIESLYRFNAKFRPVWAPRFLVYPAGRDLPRVLLASLEAEAFVVWPGRLLHWWRPRTAVGTHD